MDVKPHVYTPERLAALRSVAYHHRSSAASVLAAALGKRKKGEVRALLLSPSPNPTQARGVLRASTAHKRTSSICHSRCLARPSAS